MQVSTPLPSSTRLIFNVVAASFFAVLAIGVALLVYEATPTTALVAGLYVLCGTALVISSARQLGLISFSTLSIAFYLWFLGLFPLVRGLWHPLDTASASAHLPTYIVAAAGMLGLAFGVAVGGRCIKPTSGRSLLEKWGFDLLESWRANLLFQVIGLAAYLYSLQFGYFYLGVQLADGETGAFAGVATIARGWVLIAYTCALYHAFSGELRPKLPWQLLSLSGFAILCVFGAISLSKYYLFLPLLPPVFLLAQRRRWLALTLTALALILLYATVSPLIGLARLGLSGGVDRESLMKLISADTIVALTTFDAGASAAADPFTAFGRGMFDYLNHIVGVMGDRLQFQYGATYIHALKQLVPFAERGETLGFLYARESGMLAWDDLVTNLSPTTLGDHYINFGIAGAACGMLAMGFLYVWFDRRLTREGHWTAIYLLLFINLNEAFIGQGWVGLAKNLIATILVFATVRASSDFFRWVLNTSTADPNLRSRA